MFMLPAFSEIGSFSWEKIHLYLFVFIKQQGSRLTWNKYGGDK